MSDTSAKQTSTRAVLGSVAVAVFLSALDQTIVGNALPRIAAELDGLAWYAWVFTAYMLASTSFVPVAGKLGDLFGRKPVLLAGIAVFVAGSLLAGFAGRMLVLVAARAVQGLGAGIISSNANALVGDLYPPAERARPAGLLSGVYALASLVGPPLGGAIADRVGWRWVFFLNVPLGAAVAMVLLRRLPAPPPRARASGAALDWAGALTLSGAATATLLALTPAKAGARALTFPPAALLALAAALAVAFVVIERRHAEPIVPLDLFRSAAFSLAVAVCFVSGAAIYVIAVFVPLFVQGALGVSATRAGLVMMPMMLALVVGSVACGRIVARTGSPRPSTTAGLTLATLGYVTLSRLDTSSHLGVAAAGLGLVGLGIGLALPALVVAAQSAVAPRHLGVSTSLTQFARTFGGTLGVAAMGALLTRALEPRLAGGLTSLREPRALLDPAALARAREALVALDPAGGSRAFDEALAAARGALAASLTLVFAAAAGVMGVGLLLSTFLRPLPRSAPNHDEEINQDEG